MQTKYFSTSITNRSPVILYNSPFLPPKPCWTNTMFHSSQGLGSCFWCN